MALLDVDADLCRYLTADERARIAQISVPVLSVPKGPLDPAELLGGEAFAAVVLNGLVLHHLAIGSHLGRRILGPGDVIDTGVVPEPLLGQSRYGAASETRLAALGTDFLLAARRAPRLFVGLQAVIADQTERLATQLVICQLPRVADRVLAMLWLLAESFGRVGAAGTTLPLSLTHEALGALVGARRPTVTLALGELTHRGALVHDADGWLLLEPPASARSDEGPLREDARLVEVTST
jgi:hypothetical protein